MQKKVLISALASKSQVISKGFLVFSISSKKRTKTRHIVVKTNSLVLFLEEITAWQIAFQINWPLETTKSKLMQWAILLWCKIFPVNRYCGFLYLTSIITDRVWLSLHQESNFSKNAVGDMLVLCCWHIAKFCAFGKGPFRKSSSMYYY